MTFLLDSNALLWLVFSPELLKHEILTLFDDPANTFMVNYVSLWELLAKVSRGKLLVAGTSVDNAYSSLLATGFELLPITREQLVNAAKLPHIHSDPFDRVLVAQAVELQAILLTSDSVLGRYGVSVLAI